MELTFTRPDGSLGGDEVGQTTLTIKHKRGQDAKL
jgi:hypothetical protein